MCQGKELHGRAKKRLFSWVSGVQGRGYRIMYFWDRWRFDVLVIRYPDGAYILPHTDPVPPGLRHHRLNIEIWKSGTGGAFSVDAQHIILKLPRIVWFRPDLGEHCVSEVKCGERWVFSIGWILGRRV